MWLAHGSKLSKPLQEYTAKIVMFIDAIIQHWTNNIELSMTCGVLVSRLPLISNTSCFQNVSGNRWTGSFTWLPYSSIHSQYCRPAPHIPHENHTHGIIKLASFQVLLNRQLLYAPCGHIHGSATAELSPTLPNLYHRCFDIVSPTSADPWVP